MHPRTFTLRNVRHLLKRAKELELSEGAVQRLRWFAFALEHGGNVSLTCRHFAIARTTYLRWAERFDAHDESSLEEESRRPRHVRAPETAPHVVALIRQIRESQPLLGKDAIATLLQRDYGVRVSPSTVGRTIARHGFFFASTPSHEQKRAATPTQHMLPSAATDDQGGASPFPLLPSIGTSLVLLLAVIGVCALPARASAATSSNFMLEQVGDGNAAGMTSGSQNFKLQGDISWRQEAPLHSNTFQITAAPPVPVSSAGASSSASSVASSPDNGGHRGSSHSSIVPAPRPSSSSVATSASSSSAPTSASASSASSDDLHPAASASSSSASEPTYQCATILCPGRFWHPIDLVPVPGESGSPAEKPAVSFGELFGSALSSCVDSPLSWILFLLCFVLGSVFTTLFFLLGWSRGGVRRALIYAVLVTLGLSMFAAMWIQSADAASSPERHVYNGHLLNASGQAITTPHYIRFSEWYSRDKQATDVDGVGAINTGAATYAGYQEVFVVTPDSQGYFSVQLGTGASLPNLASLSPLDLDNLFLQVEVKAAGNPDTSYEVLDTNPSDDLVDRSPILSVPFAQNADLLDQREIGTGSGSIPLLLSGGVLPVATIPGGTNSDTFVVDSNNTAASDITLQFGGALAETLKYDILNDQFVFSTDLKVEGDLVVTGLINGVDISTISGSDDGKLRVSSGAGLTINVTGGSYRINGDVTDYTGASGVAVAANATSYVFIGSGGLTVRTMAFPTDESFIRLAEVVTNGSAVTQVNDRRIVQSDDREQSTEVNLHAEFQNASYQADATDNTGQLSVSLDNITLRNFYLWTSTRASLQDYDIVVRVSLPADFVRWSAAPLSASYRTTSADATNSKIDVSVFDTNGTPVTLGGSATGLASTSWATTALTFDNGATWTAGQEFLVKFKLYAKDNFQAHVGSVKLNYVRLTP